MDDRVRPTRKYGTDETPKLGDVIQVFEGSFSSCIIVRVNEVKGEEPTFDLERPHAKLDLGTLSIGIERIGHVSLSRIRNHCEVFVQGSSGKIENRSY